MITSSTRRCVPRWWHSRPRTASRISRSSSRTTPTIVRLFIAINLPDDERRAIRDATASVRGAAPDVSWTAEHHLHLTLKFLGDVPDEGVAPLRDALHAVA